MPVESSTRELARSVIFGEAPPDNTIRMKFDFFLPDSFGHVTGRLPGSLELKFPGSDGSPTFIDGFRNDDSYRSSRYFGGRVNRLQQALSVGGNAVLLDRIRHENSLARTLDEKRDQPAILRLIARKDRTGRTLESLIPPNTKFFLEQVQESKEEKYQVIETFGEFMAFFFGRRPEVYSFTGTLLNARNHDWKNEFHINYDEFLRGSKCVERRAFVYIQYDDVIVEGFMLNVSTRLVGLEDKAVPFSFQMLVTNRQPVNRIELLRSRELRSGLTELERDLLKTLEQAAALARQSQSPADVAMFAIIRDFVAIGAVPAAGTALSLRDAGGGASKIVDAGTRAKSRAGDPTTKEDNARSIAQQNEDAQASRERADVIVQSMAKAASDKAAKDRLTEDVSFL